MLIDVYDANDNIICYLDSETIDGLTFQNDTFHGYLDTNAYTFDFEIPTFQNNKLVEGVEKITDGCRFGIYVNQLYFKFYIYNYVKDFNTITVSCNNLTLEVMSEQNSKFINDKDLSLEEYIKELFWNRGAKGKIGINEISDRKRKISFEDVGTKLERLQTLKAEFDAEIEIKSEPDNTIIINIYDKTKETYRGVYRQDILLTEDDFVNFEYESDKSELYNAVFVYGTKTENKDKDDEKEVTIDISGQEQEEKTEDGVTEFYTRKGSPAAYAPLSVQKYTKGMGKDGDDWISYTEETEYETEADLVKYAFSFLKEHAYPVYTFTLTVAYTDKIASLNIGDRIDIDVSKTMGREDGLWTMTVSEIEKRLSVPGTITITAVNVRRNKSKVSQSLTDRMVEIQKKLSPYELKLQTDDSLFFTDENQIISVSANLTKGGDQVNDALLTWYIDSQKYGNDAVIDVKSSMIKDTAQIKCEASILGEIIATSQLSIAKVKQGQKGDKGDKGTDGKTSYLHRAWANSSDGRADFSLTDSNNKRYLGTYSDFTAQASSNPAMYQWTALFDNVKLGNRNYALGTADEISVDTSWKAYSLSRDTWNWADTKPKLFITFDYEVESTVNRFRFNRVITSQNHRNQWDNEGMIVDTTTTKKGTFSKPINWSPYYNGETVDDITEIYLNLNYDSGSGKITIKNLRLNTGTVPMDWQKAPEDIEAEIGQKADQQLTISQLNALNEAAELAKTELEAKASLDTVNKWIIALQDEISGRKAGQEASEKALIEASNRLVAQQNTIKNMKIQTDFIETYMSQSEEGMIIGKKDGSASVKISDSRISFFSAGKETAFISQGILQIENGIFTKKLQIGRYRIEQYDLNPDMNVVRYVGGGVANGNFS